MNGRLFALLAMVGAFGGSMPEADLHQRPEPGPDPEPPRRPGEGAVIVQGAPMKLPSPPQVFVAHTPRPEPRRREEANAAQRKAAEKRARRAKRNLTGR